MKRKDAVRDEKEDRFYPIFNEFREVRKKRRPNPELHFIVPWEMMEETTKKFVF